MAPEDPWRESGRFRTHRAGAAAGVVKAAADAHLSASFLPADRLSRPAVILRTKRLILREFQADDWKPTHTYQNDPRYLRFYDRDGMSPADTQALIAAFLGFEAERPRRNTQLAILLARTGELIGNVGVRRESPDHPVADMGYELAPKHWGHGYATEAARAMRDWVFGDEGLTRLHAHCIAENDASARVLEKLGMRREGLLRDHVFQKGRFWDVLLYGILRDEWAAGEGNEP